MLSVWPTHSPGADKDLANLYGRTTEEAASVYVCVRVCVCVQVRFQPTDALVRCKVPKSRGPILAGCRYEPPIGRHLWSHSTEQRGREKGREANNRHALIG